FFTNCFNDGAATYHPHTSHFVLRICVYRRSSAVALVEKVGPAMKMIVAIIRPEKLEDVQAALNERDVYLMTVSEVRGCGRQRGYAEMYRGTEYKTRLLPKLKIEIAVNDAFVDATMEAIVHAARAGTTGQVGDGK